MSMMVSFVLSFFPRDVLDEILNLIESVSEDFPSYSSLADMLSCCCFCSGKFQSPGTDEVYDIEQKINSETSNKL